MRRSQPAHMLLPALRRVAAGIDAPDALARRAQVALHLPAVDHALGGGLICGAVHEIWPSAAIHSGAATGFALALATLTHQERREVVWIETDFAATEAGHPYGPGLDLLGLARNRLLLLRVARMRDALWAMEEGLRCRAVAVVLAELTPGVAADLTATRRLALAAREGGGLGLILHHRPSLLASAAMTRWEVSSARGQRDAFGGMGRTAFVLSLVRNRRGPVGRWLVTWDHHERVFALPAPSLDMAETAGNRPDHAPCAQAG
ncbi:MAG: hypothetical protein HY056_17150 [Proteobacteria bacterium]|nr:hypothetical protein [Pseudomonadota bacterium]